MVSLPTAWFGHHRLLVGSGSVRKVAKSASGLPAVPGVWFLNLVCVLVDFVFSMVCDDRCVACLKAARLFEEGGKLPKKS